MQPRLIEPQFKVGSYGERCQAFFDPTNTFYPASEDGDVLDWEMRAVTWARSPYWYWLEQLATSTVDLSGRKKIEHKMFQLALVSAPREIDQRRELNRWMITQPGSGPEQISFFNNTFESVEQGIESGEIARDVAFVAQNNLCIPNEEELERLDFILELGRLDGFAQLPQ